MFDFITIGLTPPLMIAMAFVLPIFTLFIRRKGFYDVYALIATTLALILTAYNYYLVLYVVKQPIVYPFGGWPPPIGIVYEVDALSAYFGLFTAAIMLMIAIYSIWYLKGTSGYEWYYTMLLGLEAGMIGCVYTGDAFNLFVMLEVLSVAAYGLVVFYRMSHEAVEAGMKYSLIGAVATTVYFIALVFIYGSFGTLNMADIAYKSRGGITFPYSGMIVGNIHLASAVALALSMWAFTFKSAVVPNHFWLPDAHPAAPTPVSAALSGLVVKVGIYAIIRFLYTIYGLDSVQPISNVVSTVMKLLIVLGALSALIASALMIVQSDIKRLIAYSTIMHVGFIVISLSLGTKLGIEAALYHTVNHAVGKALLFMSAGVLIKVAGSRDIDEMSGVGRYLRLTTLTLTLAVLSLEGLPPLAGFFSKLLLYEAFIDSGLALLAMVLIISSAFALLAYIKLLYGVYFKLPTKEFTNVREEWTYLIPLLALAASLVLLGISAPMFVEKVLAYISDELFNPLKYVRAADSIIKVLGG
ncbi:MAG: proton-conducting transporter membrane subunit [Sulfolobales archaeon]|nr:proton-conducting transporter membrane subunit [Sulfolobales archaeon]